MAERINSVQFRMGFKNYLYLFLIMMLPSLARSSGVCGTGSLLTTFNPFTGKPDYVCVGGTAPAAFAVATFSDGQSSTIEEGAGVWKAAGALSFTASYTSGPPIGSTITFSGWSPLALASPFTAATSVADVNFPSVAGTVVFTLTAQQTGTATKTITHTFNNDRYYGTTTNATGSYSSSDITGLGQSDLVNSIPATFTVSPGASDYIAFAYPARLGTASFSVGGFPGGFLPAVTVSVTNGSGFTENFSVYRSVNPNLGSTTVTVTTP